MGDQEWCLVRFSACLASFVDKTYVIAALPLLQPIQLVPASIRSFETRQFSVASHRRALVIVISHTNTLSPKLGYGHGFRGLRRRSGTGVGRSRVHWNSKHSQKPDRKKALASWSRIEAEGKCRGWSVQGYFSDPEEVYPRRV